MQRAPRALRQPADSFRTCGPGTRVGRKRVARLMQDNGLKGRLTRLGSAILRTAGRWRAGYTWRSCWTFTRDVSLAGAMRKSLNRELAIAALRQAIVRRRPDAGLIHDTDRGSQYASGDYQTVMKQHGIDGSMGAAGHCWDNAVAESFFATLKNELVHGCAFFTRTEAYDTVSDYIED